MSRIKRRIRLQTKQRITLDLGLKECKKYSKGKEGDSVDQLKVREENFGGPKKKAALFRSWESRR